VKRQQLKLFFVPKAGFRKLHLIPSALNMFASTNPSNLYYCAVITSLRFEIFKGKNILLCAKTQTTDNTKRTALYIKI